MVFSKNIVFNSGRYYLNQYYVSCRIVSVVAVTVFSRYLFTIIVIREETGMLRLDASTLGCFSFIEYL